MCSLVIPHCYPCIAVAADQGFNWFVSSGERSLYFPTVICVREHPIEATQPSFPSFDWLTYLAPL